MTLAYVRYSDTLGEREAIGWIVRSTPTVLVLTNDRQLEDDADEEEAIFIPEADIEWRRYF